MNETAVRAEALAAVEAGTQVTAERVSQIMDRPGILREAANVALQNTPAGKTTVAGAIEAKGVKISGSYKTGGGDA